MGEKINVPSINRVIISGRLVSDSELRYNQNDNSLLTFSIASSKRYFKDNEWKENTIYLKIVSWLKNNEKLSEKLKKGMPVLIEGSLTINKWQDKNTGNERYEYQIRADRIHVLIRQTFDNTDYQEQAKKIDNIDEKFDEVDKDIEKILDNDNNGGTDDIPF